MTYNWQTCPLDIKNFIYKLNSKIKKVIKGKFAGCYLHGSLALGGFNPKHSDIDMLTVTLEPLNSHEKKALAHLLLEYSASPFPVEISFLNTGQLKRWQHPCPFDFHYSEYWRERYESDLTMAESEFLNETIHTDPDLAAHITIVNAKGICIEGVPITSIFPEVPKNDYISSIMGDFRECLKCIKEKPVYCSLNLLRVLWYLKERVISSKLDAGNWGIKVLPDDLGNTVRKSLEIYTGERESHQFNKYELSSLSDYVNEKADLLLQSR